MNNMKCLSIIGIIIIMLLFAYLNKKQQNQKESHRQIIKSLIRQTARWAVASQQDTSPMIAILHANYAVGYLQALQTIATENELMQETDIHHLEYKVYQTQDNAVKKIIKACPQYVGDQIDKKLAILGISPVASHQ